MEVFHQGTSGQTLIQALATNKADIGAGLILDWLKLGITSLRLGVLWRDGLIANCGGLGCTLRVR